MNTYTFNVEIRIRGVGKIEFHAAKFSMKEINIYNTHTFATDGIREKREEKKNYIILKMCIYVYIKINEYSDTKKDFRR